MRANNSMPSAGEVFFLKDGDGDYEIDWKTFCNLPCSFHTDRRLPKKKLMEQMIGCGVLSYTATDNWEVFILGAHIPTFKGQMLFFTRYEDALNFCKTKMEQVPYEAEIRKISYVENVKLQGKL